MAGLRSSAASTLWPQQVTSPGTALSPSAAAGRAGRGDKEAGSRHKQGKPSTARLPAPPGSWHRLAPGTAGQLSPRNQTPSSPGSVRPKTQFPKPVQLVAAGTLSPGGSAGDGHPPHPPAPWLTAKQTPWSLSLQHLPSPIRSQSGGCPPKASPRAYIHQALGGGQDGTAEPMAPPCGLEQASRLAAPSSK